MKKATFIVILSTLVSVRLLYGDCWQTQNNGHCGGANVTPTCQNDCHDEYNSPPNQTECCTLGAGDGCGWTDCTTATVNVNHYTMFGTEGFGDFGHGPKCIGCGEPWTEPIGTPAGTCTQAAIPASADTCNCE